MQLKLQRSQREAGIMSKSVHFCLDALVQFTPEELANIRRYKLQHEVIYNSAASKKLLDKAAATDANEQYGLGSLKQTGLMMLASMHLNISISSLQQGQHIECKSMIELLGAEEAIMSACRTLKSYLETAATFDGQEFLYDFSTDVPEIIATAPNPGPLPLGAPRPKAEPAPPRPMGRPSADPAPSRPSEPGTDVTADHPARTLARLLKAQWRKDPMYILLGGGAALLFVVWLLSVIF